MLRMEKNTQGTDGQCHGSLSLLLPSLLYSYPLVHSLSPFPCPYTPRPPRGKARELSFSELMPQVGASFPYVF